MTYSLKPLRGGRMVTLNAAFGKTNNPFYLVNGKKITNLSELKDAIKDISDEDFVHHVNPDKNDFANWVRGVFKDNDLASAIENATSINSLYALLDSRVSVVKAEQPTDAEQPGQPAETPEEIISDVRDETLQKLDEILNREREIIVREQKIKEAEERIEKKLLEGMSKAKNDPKAFSKEFMQGIAVGFLIGLIIFLIYFKFFS